MRRAFLLAWLLALLLAAAACDSREFKCTANNECLDKHGQPALCLLSHCATPDDLCATHFRWDDTAGVTASQCVSVIDLPPPDAGVATDARPGDAGSDAN